MSLSLLPLPDLFFLQLFYLIHPKVFHGFWWMHKPNRTSTNPPDKLVLRVAVQWYMQHQSLQGASQLLRWHSGLCDRIGNGINRLGQFVGLDLPCWLCGVILSYYIYSSKQFTLFVVDAITSIWSKLRAEVLPSQPRLQASPGHADENKTSHCVIGSSLNYLV